MRSKQILMRHGERMEGRGTSDNFQSHITGVSTIRRRETTEDEI